MSKKIVLMVIAKGSETIEIVIPYDSLKYADIDVTLAGVENREPVSTSCNMKIIPDVALVDVKDNIFDAVILPGGLVGTEKLRQSGVLVSLLKRHFNEGKIIATICGGVLTLVDNEIGVGKKVTTYPLYKEQIKNGFVYVDEKVVVDGNLISSQGPGTAFDFAFKIIELLKGEEMMLKVKKGSIF